MPSIRYSYEASDPLFQASFPSLPVEPAPRGALDDARALFDEEEVGERRTSVGEDQYCFMACAELVIDRGYAAQ
jgi:hypothetical protein